MDVAEEAGAPEPIRAEGAEGAPSTVEAAVDPEPAINPEPATAAASPPEALPIAPAAPTGPALSPITAEDEPLPFQPTFFRRVVAEPFWAGLLGSGASLWLGGTIGALASAGLLKRPRPETVILVSVLLGLGAAMARGFRAPLRSYSGLVGRVVGALFFGAGCAGITVLMLALILDGLRVRDESAYVTIALVGALLAGLALARVHGIGAEKPRRIKIAVGVAAVILVSSWAASPSLRCRLGFGEGCRDAADAAGNKGDYRAAGTIGARGCEHEDSVSCRLAGQAFQSEGPARDLRRAEGLFREGCALGDPESCERVHAIELERRCDRYGAFACAELARAHARGDGAPRDAALAQRYYRKACLLGANDACNQSGGR
jgi:hypothetical protein